MKKTLFAFLVLVALCPAGLVEGVRAQTPDAPLPKPAPKPAPKAAPAAKPASQQSQPDLDKVYRDLRGEWRRVGQGFACDVKAPQALPPGQRTVDALAVACLHMGSFVIGAEAGALKKLGAPARTLPQQKGATGHVYFLETPGSYPYLVATVLNNRIVALQISGQAPAKGYGFNRLNLGDSKDALLKEFGSPNHVGPSGRKDADLWEYRPFTFTFEVEKDRVTSIRIADPTY